MTTLDLFDWKPTTRKPNPPFAKGSPTSEAAAESIKPLLAHLEQVVLDAVRNAGKAGATCDQIEGITGLSHQTASARFRGLEQRGLLRRTELRRPTRSGRAASVYVVAGEAA